MRASTAFLLLLVVALAATSASLWRSLENERRRAGVSAADLDSAESPGGREVPAGPHVAGPAEVAQHAVEPGASPEPDFMYDEVRLYRNEAYRDAQRRYRRLQLAESYIDVTDVLGISRETADRLIALLVDQELRYLSEPHPNPRNDEEMQARRLENERRRSESDAEIASVIGELNLSKWHDYQASLPVRYKVREFSLELAGEGYPLRDDQVEALIGIIHGEQQRARDALTEFSAGLVWSDGLERKSNQYLDARRRELERAADDRIRSAAGRILSTSQLEALFTSLHRDRALERARLASREAAIEAQRRADRGE